LNSLPAPPIPLSVNGFNEDRVKQLAESFGSKEKVIKVLEEFTSIPHAPYVQLPKIPESLGPVQTLPIELDNLQQDMLNATVTNHSTEIVVDHISQAKWDESQNRALWLTYFSDNSHSWLARSSFEDPDGTTNDIFLSWCQQNRIPIGPPKKGQDHSHLKFCWHQKEAEGEVEIEEQLAVEVEIIQVRMVE